MSRLRWETNLGQLCRNLESYAAIVPDPDDRAASLSESLYLAHSASEDKFRSDLRQRTSVFKGPIGA